MSYENMKLQLRSVCWTALYGCQDHNVHGPKDAEHSVGVVSVDFPDPDNGEITYILKRDYGILVRCGLHCVPLAHRTLGIRRPLKLAADRKAV